MWFVFCETKIWVKLIVVDSANFSNIFSFKIMIFTKIFPFSFFFPMRKSGLSMAGVATGHD